MKPELQGKLMVAMLVSVLAFGFGTGTILVTGQYQALNTTTFDTNTPDLPPIYTNTNNMNTGNTSGSSNTPSTPSTPSTSDNPTGGQNGGQNPSNNPPSSNNTTQNQ